MRSQVEIQVTFGLGVLRILSFHMFPLPRVVAGVAWCSLVAAAISMHLGTKVRKVAGQGARRTGFEENRSPSGAQFFFLR